jgi:hypothetical protein
MRLGPPDAENARQIGRPAQGFFGELLDEMIARRSLLAA